jgi:hypothetical protein
MRASQILDEQIIHVKRGRQNGFGFEPLWNSYFDFYLDIRYFGEPLLELQDVTFHLYLRKNLNDKNPAWKMPTLRQIKGKFGISSDKIYAMFARLEKAHLLSKESGIRTGTVNARNEYILSDPIPTLTEFLEVAQEGLFGLSLLSEYVLTAVHSGETPAADLCAGNRHMDVPETGTSHVPEIGTINRLLKDKQISEKQIDSAFEELRFLVGEKTFDRFMDGAKLITIEEGIAVIGIIHAYAKDWIENRIKDKIKRSLKVEGVRCVVLSEN